MFSTDVLHIPTKYALDQPLNANWFSVPCSSICGPRGLNSFVSCVHCKPRVFNWSFSNLHHTCLIPKPRWQSIFGTLQFHFGHILFFLYVPFTLWLSKDLFQIHIKHSLDHSLDPSTFSLPICCICDHLGTTFVFLVCTLQSFQWIFFRFTLITSFNFTLHQYVRQCGEILF